MNLDTFVVTDEHLCADQVAKVRTLVRRNSQVVSLSQVLGF